MALQGTPHLPPPTPEKALLGMSVETGSPGRSSFTQLWQRTMGEMQQFSSVPLLRGTSDFLLASPALCSSFGFRNLINMVGLSSTTGLRGKPLRLVPNFTGRKEGRKEKEGNQH